MHETIDTGALKGAHGIADVIARYGVALRLTGRTLVGRCPFHEDRGRPNLAVYPATASWYCFRCAIGGDVIAFVQRMEGVGFREASSRLGSLPSRLPRRRPSLRSARPIARGADERACLAAALDLFENTLADHLPARAYLHRRGLGPATWRGCRVGYAVGEQLIPYLRWRGLPVGAAIRVGVLDRRGRERFAGRIVVPEMRQGAPIWLIGRALEPHAEPRYLALAGPRPLLGWEQARESQVVTLTEGVFDWLVLRQWNVPALAVLGSSVRPADLRALQRFSRVVLALDADPAGRVATATLLEQLGARATATQLPDGVKDLADLALRPDGEARFRQALAVEAVAA